MELINAGMQNLLKEPAKLELEKIRKDISSLGTRFQILSPLTPAKAASPHLFEELKKVNDKALEIFLEVIEHIQAIPDDFSPAVAYAKFFTYYGSKLRLVASQIDFTMLKMFASGEFQKETLTSLLNEEHELQEKMKEIKKKKIVDTSTFDSKEHTVGRILLQTFDTDTYVSAQQSLFFQSRQFLQEQVENKKCVKFLDRQAQILRAIDVIAAKKEQILKVDCKGKQDLLEFQIELVENFVNDLLKRHKSSFNQPHKTPEEINDEILELLKKVNARKYGAYVRPYVIGTEILEHLKNSVDKLETPLSQTLKEKLLRILSGLDPCAWLEETVGSFQWSQIPSSQVASLGASLYTLTYLALSQGKELAKETHQKLMNHLQNAAVRSCVVLPRYLGRKSVDAVSLSSYADYTEIARSAMFASRQKISGKKDPLHEHKSIDERWVFKTVEEEMQKSVGYFRRCRLVANACIQYSAIEKILGGRLDVRLIRFSALKQPDADVFLSVMETLKAYWRAIHEAKTYTELLVALAPILCPILVASTVFFVPTLISIFPILAHILSDFTIVTGYAAWVVTALIKDRRVDYAGPLTFWIERQSKVRSKIEAEILQSKLKKLKKDTFDEIKAGFCKDQTYETWMNKLLNSLYVWGKLPFSFSQEGNVEDHPRKEQIQGWVEESLSKLNRNYSNPTEYIQNLIKHEVFDHEEICNLIHDKTGIKEENPEFQPMFEFVIHIFVEEIKKKLFNLIVKRHEELFLKYNDENAYFSQDEFSQRILPKDMKGAVQNLDEDEDLIEKLVGESLTLNHLKSTFEKHSLFQDCTDKEYINMVTRFVLYRKSLIKKGVLALTSSTTIQPPLLSA